MTNPRLPDMAQDGSLDDEEGFGADADDAGADARSPSNAPGSLLSLRIRKRAAAAVSAPATLRRAEAPRPSAPSTPAPADPDPISQAPQAVQSASRAPAEPNPASQAALRKKSDASAQTTNIVTYWTRLKGTRHYPRVTDLDHGNVTSAWPNSILMRCRPGSKALQPDRVFSTADSGAGGLASLRANARINLSPMMLQWVLGLAGEVVRTGRPMQDEDEFPSSRRSARYRAVALPFSNDDRFVDHVLCHVTPAN